MLNLGSSLDLALLLLHLAMAVIVVEALALTLWQRRTGRGLTPAELWPNLGAGLALMLALRTAMTGGSWVWVGLGLSASGLLHLLDMRQRTRR